MRATSAPLLLFVIACGTEVTLRSPDGDGPEPDDGHNPDTAPPIAICGAQPDPAAPLSPVDFIGETSYDPDDNPLIAWRWTLAAAPYGSIAELPPGAANRPGFLPDMAGTYVATLVVTDDAGNTSPPCAAEVEVQPPEALWIEAFWTVGGDDIDLMLNRKGELSGACMPGDCTGLDWGTPGDTTDDPRHARADIDKGPELIGLLAPDDPAYTIALSDRTTTIRTADNDVTVRIFKGGALHWQTTVTLADEPPFVPVADITWPAGIVTEL